ncbi:MAG: hypothetical protein ABIK94_03530, partial [candidate division WOR-3 bacterium]
MDSFHSYPESISSDLSFQKRDSGLVMTISFLPQEEKSFFVYYEQKLRGREARYIVKTTQKWRRPLKLAHFLIELPESLSSYKISYSADSTKREGGEMKVYF